MQIQSDTHLAQVLKLFVDFTLRYPALLQASRLVWSTLLYSNLL